MANHSMIIVSGAVLFLGLLCRFSHAQEETDCRGVPLNLSDEQKKQIKDCLTENNITSLMRMPLDRVSCFGLCILKRKDLLTAAGKLDHDKIFAYIENAMKPDEVKPLIKNGIEKCMKDHGDTVDAHDGDPKCGSFQDVGICVHEVFYDICIEGKDSSD